MKKRVTLLGSTGSVGQSTVRVISERLDEFDVVALIAHSNVEVIAKQAYLLNPQQVGLRDPSTYQDLKKAIVNPHIKVCAGEEAFWEAIDQPCDWFLSSLVGVAGLMPTYRALQPNRVVALANKESLVVGGRLMMERVQDVCGVLLPVDSEHSAFFQIMQSDALDLEEKLILTASGGPFLNRSFDSLASVTVEEALCHPNWVMGSKITIDSATLVNKGLEIIEAHYLFQCPEDKIDVLIHPQSIIHAIVQYCDGSYIAHLGYPDMRIPIAYALSWPERFQTNFSRLDFTKIQELTFIPPNSWCEDSLNLARSALCAGKELVFNAANEVAVQRFLNKDIGFQDIFRYIQKSLDVFDSDRLNSVEDMVSLDIEIKEKILMDF